MNGILPRYGCSACDFSFVAGWSHQDFGSFAYCRACAADLLLRSLRSGWAPEPGEVLQVRQFTEGKWRKTQFKLPPFPGPSNPSEETYQAFLSVVLSDLACPSCSSVGRIASSPENDEPCPACRVGKLVTRGTVIP